MKKLVILSAFLVFAFVGAQAQSKAASTTETSKKIEAVTTNVVTELGDKPVAKAEAKKECHDKKGAKGKKSCCCSDKKKECGDKKAEKVEMKISPSEVQEAK